MMKRVMLWAMFCVIGLGMTGCVAQSEADRMRTAYRQSEAQVQDLRARLDERNAMIAAMQADGQRRSDVAGQLQDALAERDRLRAALSQAENALRNMQAPGDALPVELSDALAEMAAANPDLMIYDAQRGMIQLRSDLTFALGSANLSTGAQSSLQSLAGVLSSRLAREYEVQIVGHTDNVPVRNPANVQRFGDNWGLSAARARSVLKQLESNGVAPQRMSIAGYGEYRPVVANGPQGAAANRRVEIYLRPATEAGAASASAPSQAPEARSTPAQRSPANNNEPAPVTGPPSGFK